MKDVVIIANYIVTPDETGNGRFNYIAEELSRNSQNKVEIITSLFSHIKKEKRNKNLKFKNYELKMLDEPGYKKNISLKRIYSHWKLGKNLKKYLEKRNPPDVIYCAVPSLSIAKIACKYAKEKNIRFMIDIQDLWPEAFKMILNPPFLGKIIYSTFERDARFIYENADEILGVSDTYIKKALSLNKKLKIGHSVFLGNDLDEFDSFQRTNNIKKQSNEFWLTYVGTLGHSYDIEIIMRALKIIKDKYSIDNIIFMIVGDGPLKNKFKKYSKKLEIKTNFIGRVSYEKVAHYLNKSDLVVNPIKKGAAQSIINKVGDYAAAGKAVINTQECLEYRNLIYDKKIGLNCENSNSKDIAEKIYKLYLDEDLRINMGINNRKLAEEKFNRKKTYKQIIKLVEQKI